MKNSIVQKQVNKISDSYSVMQYTPLEDNTLDLNVENGNGTSNSKSKSSSNPISRALNKKSSSNELAEPLTGSGIENGHDDHGNNGTQHPGSGDDDPFYVFKDDLHRKLGFMEESLSNYLSVINNTVRTVKDAKITCLSHLDKRGNNE